MEASHHYYPIKTQNFFCSSLFTPKTRSSSSTIPSQSIHAQLISFPQRRRPGSIVAAIGCVKVAELEREWEEEMKSSISGEDEIGEKWREKCEKEGEGGIVELMECLEREAIMGEDEGREPIDYNRRAFIFGKSSRVFQALKEKDEQKS